MKAKTRELRRKCRMLKNEYQRAIDEWELCWAVDQGHGWDTVGVQRDLDDAFNALEGFLKSHGVTLPKRFSGSLVEAIDLHPHYAKSEYGLTFPRWVYA